MKEITKEKEEKRQDNQKNEVLKRKGKNKDNKRKENMKGQQAALDKNLPGVQARCFFWVRKSILEFQNLLGRNF